ncbi:MAG: phenylalanine--tRNA ligase subunit alpha [Bernardetiaceae bacterium]
MNDLLDRIAALEAEMEQTTIADTQALEAFRLQFISKKGPMANLFNEFKQVSSPEQKRQLGQQLNRLKQQAEEKFRQARAAIEDQQHAKAGQGLDLSLPPIPAPQGSIHPINQTRREIAQIFERMGFNISQGPEIETDWYNFSALNFPPNHPAREMQDTFFIEKDPDVVLRTHTSSVQIRTMEKERPPIRTLSIGRVYRNETISARAHCMFHQVEGLYIDKNVSFRDLKQTLLHFAQELFGKNTRIRLRPSYFPFTEPSAEMDIYWGLKTDVDRRITKGTGWLEILGCGMVDPAVLENCRIDPDIYTGFAFGMGIERMVMLLHQIPDLRLFTENDVRFLRQFTAF